MQTSYTPVPYVFREIIEEEIDKKTTGKIFYYGDDQTICEVIGTIERMNEMEGKGLFITLTPKVSIRIDRIITLFGKPGAAYDEYTAYANECLSCTGGYL